MPIQLSGSLAITGSLTTSTTIGAQGAINITNATNPISFTSTASFYTDGGIRVTKDMFVSGTSYFNNVTVYGTQSVQYITSSQVNIGANIITVNTDTPSIRFGGLAVYDSGSTGLTGSMLWDSQNNHWVYANPSGSTYSGGMFISGPRSSALGSEQGTTFNALMKGQGGDHITSSGVFESGSNVGIGTSTPVTNLHVVNNTNVGLRLQATAANGSAELDLLSNGTQNAFLDYGPNALRFRSTNADMSAINNGSVLVLENGGNVGIGTTSPLGNLDVSTSSGNTSVNITAGNTGLSRLIFGTTSGNNRGFIDYDNTSSVRAMIFRTNENEAMRITSGGNVGIGVTPSAWTDYRVLQLGGGSISSYTDNNFFEVNQNAFWNGVYRYVNNGSASRYQQNAGRHEWYVAQSGTAGNTISFTQAMTLDASGRLGIGTTNPSGYSSPANQLVVGTNSGNNGITIAGGTTGLSSIYFADGTTGNEAFRGYIEYGHTTDALAFGTAAGERMRITSNGVLLVGTTSNPYSLGAFVVNHNSSLTRTYLQRGVDLIEFIPSDGTTPNIISSSYTSAGSAYKPLSISARQNNADLYLATNGNVGIGTTFNGIAAPALLTIKASATGGNQIYIVQSNDDRGWRFRAQTDGHFYLQSSYLGSDTTNFMITYDTGRVGIGTTSPATTLDVNGQAIIRAMSGASLSLIGNDTLNSPWGLTWSTSTYTGGVAAIRVARRGATDASDMMFFTSPNGDIPNERVRITSGGNVLVGTTTDRVGQIQTPNISVFGNTGTPGDSIGLIRFRNEISTGFTNAEIRGLLGPNFVNDGIISFATRDAGSLEERLRITNGGNVGIGLTSVPTRLAIVGGSTFQFGVDGNSGNNQIYLRGGTTGDKAQIVLNHYGFADYAIGVGYVANGALSITKTSGGTDGIIITGSGNVGIGTSSPSYKLDVYTAGATSAIRVNADANQNSQLRFEEASNVKFAITYVPADDSTRFFHNTGDLITLSGAGNMGIGTTTPYGRLHLTGIYDGAQNTLNLENNWPNTHRTSLINFWAYYNSTNPQAVIEAGQDVSATNAGVIEFKTMLAGAAPATRMIIKPNGNVGIGTTNPLVRLHVGDGSQTAINGASNKIHIATTGTRSALLTLANSSGGTTVEGQFESSAESADLRIIIGSTTNHDVVFRTNNAERMRITNSGTIQPGANGTQDLGTSSLRWATVFTSDLDMSNGIGDYTIVEGEEDLFLYNNKTNKVFKFLIQEVDPSTAPPKKIRN